MMSDDDDGKKRWPQDQRKWSVNVCPLHPDLQAWEQWILRTHMHCRTQQFNTQENYQTSVKRPHNFLVLSLLIFHCDEIGAIAVIYAFKDRRKSQHMGNVSQQQVVGVLGSNHKTVCDPPSP